MKSELSWLTSHSPKYVSSRIIYMTLSCTRAQMLLLVRHIDCYGDGSAARVGAPENLDMVASAVVPYRGDGIAIDNEVILLITLQDLDALVLLQRRHLPD